MQDKELYQQILGLSSPWKVTDVELDRASSEIRVKVDHPRGSKFCCPECKTELPCHDHAEERSIEQPPKRSSFSRTGTMAIKRRVGGYRNRENFKTAIFFYCGGLDLYPR